MSKGNVEVVSGCLAAYMRGDNEAALTAFAPDVEFDVTVRPEGELFRGREGVAEAMRVWRGAFDDWTHEVDELRDLGDRVLVFSHERGRGRGSGAIVDQDDFNLVTLRDGEIVHWKLFLDRDQALEAAGLRE
jgi:ketosteroid isomerase-like protein